MLSLPGNKQAEAEKSSEEEQNRIKPKRSTRIDFSSIELNELR